jgi:hypothetical protein
MNPLEAGRAVVKQSSNGQTYLQIKIERYVRVGLPAESNDVDSRSQNYLGHSINAPTGRWQKNKDVHWYNRDLKSSEEERREEIRKVKEAEAEAMSIAL